MKAAFVDSSAVASVLLGEPGGRAVASRLERFDRLLAATLLEAEIRALLAREGVTESPDVVLAVFSWVLPDRPLTAEYEQVLARGHVRGADLHHLATALFVDPSASELAFVTLDARQKKLAAQLGFAT